MTSASDEKWRPFKFFFSVQGTGGSPTWSDPDNRVGDQDDIKTKQLQWYGHVSRMEEGRLPKEVMKWRPPGRRKRGRLKRTWADGIRGLLGGKGIDRRRLEWQKQLEEEDTIIAKRAQEDVETLYNLLNNNNQDTGSPGRPVSSGLQVPGEPGHCRARTRPPWCPSRGVFPSN